jgi:anti-sigma B factor antagonist
MQIKFEERGRWLIARPDVQRLDALAAPDFGAAMNQNCKDRAAIVLDLANVTFIDSRGLAALVSLFKSLAPESTLRLANVREPVVLLLKMTRLNQLMSIYASIDAAVAD